MTAKLFKPGDEADIARKKPGSGFRIFWVEGQDYVGTDPESVAQKYVDEVLRPHGPCEVVVKDGYSIAHRFSVDAIPTYRYNLTALGSKYDEGGLHSKK